MEKAAEFPKFECVISNTKEDYDSEIETFFTQLGSVQSDIGLLLLRDKPWEKNYRKFLGYLQDLETAIIFRRGIPESEFLKDLVLKPDSENEMEDEISDVLLRAKDDIPAILVRAQAKTREVGGLYVRMSRIPRFADGFTVERFEGLPNLRKALWRRAVETSKH